MRLETRVGLYLVGARYFRYGFAPPMHGKSMTCRQRAFLTSRVYDPSFPVGDRQIQKSRVAGKSETCRASEWQSHCAGGSLLLWT